MWQEGAQDQLDGAGDLGIAGLVTPCPDLLEALLYSMQPHIEVSSITLVLSWPLCPGPGLYFACDNIWFACLGQSCCVSDFSFSLGADLKHWPKSLCYDIFPSVTNMEPGGRFIKCFGGVGT